MKYYQLSWMVNKTMGGLVCLLEDNLSVEITGQDGEYYEAEVSKSFCFIDATSIEELKKVVCDYIDKVDRDGNDVIDIWTFNEVIHNKLFIEEDIEEEANN